MTPTPSADMPDVIAEVRGKLGMITLNRPKALNALSLGMVRDLLGTLLAWQKTTRFWAWPFVAATRKRFCILHAGSSGNPQLEDFFTEEYALNHLIHSFGKPYIAFMDGIVMGGGMGISQGGSLRIVTERTKMAMPETAIGLFPDVGGYFLSRCPGAVGEWLALTGDTIGAGDALAFGLADGCIPRTAGRAVGDPGDHGLCQCGGAQRRGALPLCERRTQEWWRTVPKSMPASPAHGGGHCQGLAGRQRLGPGRSCHVAQALAADAACGAGANPPRAR
jgi:enoyl-CoA hydratase/carnithine racemase